MRGQQQRHQRRLQVLQDAEHPHAVSRRDDGDAFVGPEVAQITITRHDEVGVAGNGACEDAIVIGISRHDLVIGLVINRYEFGWLP